MVAEEVLVMLFCAKPELACSPEISTSIFMEGLESNPPAAEKRESGEREKERVART